MLVSESRCTISSAVIHPLDSEGYKTYRSVFPKFTFPKFTFPTSVKSSAKEIRKMILNTIKVGLIIGVLSLAITVAAGTPPWISMMGYVNTTVDDIEEFDRQMCGTNEGSTTYDEHKQSRVTFASCITSLMTDSRNEFTGAGGDLDHPDASGEMYKGLCRRVPKVENCISNFTESMKTCLDPSKHETADIVYDALSAGLRFMCQDRGARVKKFFNDGCERCIYERRLDIILCAAPLLKYIKKTVPNGAALGGLGTLHLLVPNVEKCKIFDELQTCAVEAVKNCPNQMSSDIVNPLFNVASKAMTCDRLLGKSEASPANVINVLLMTVSTVLMSLRFV